MLTINQIYQTYALPQPQPLLYAPSRQTGRNPSTALAALGVTQYPPTTTIPGRGPGTVGVGLKMVPEPLVDSDIMFRQ